MKIINTKNAEHYRWGNKADGWHLLKSDNLSVIEESMPPGEKEQRHYHNHAQQFFYVLSGEATIEILGSVFKLQVGDCIHVEAQQAHQVFNSSKEQLKFIVISEPKSHGDRVKSSN